MAEEEKMASRGRNARRNAGVEKREFYCTATPYWMFILAESEEQILERYPLMTVEPLTDPAQYAIRRAIWMRQALSEKPDARLGMVNRWFDIDDDGGLYEYLHESWSTEPEYLALPRERRLHWATPPQDHVPVAETPPGMREFLVRDRCVNAPRSRFVMCAASGEEIVERYPCFDVEEVQPDVNFPLDVLEQWRACPGPGHEPDSAVRHRTDTEQESFARFQQRIWEDQRTLKEARPPHLQPVMLPQHTWMRIDTDAGFHEEYLKYHTHLPTVADGSTGSPQDDGSAAKPSGFRVVMTRDEGGIGEGLYTGTVIGRETVGVGRTDQERVVVRLDTPFLFPRASRRTLFGLSSMVRLTTSWKT